MGQSPVGSRFRQAAVSFSNALHYPTGVAVTPEGKLLVADAYNYRIQWFDAGGNPIRRVGDHLFWLWPLRTSSKGDSRFRPGWRSDRTG
jgi:hypothetical protein